jgi:hypothetical protein
MRNLLLITLLAAVTPSLNAQQMASASPHFARSYHHGGHSHSFFDPLAFYDPFYSDYLFSTGDAAASQPPVSVVQTPQAAAPVPEHASSPTQQLMVELQGDRYVRLSGEETSETEMIDSVATKLRRQDRSAAAATQPATASESAPAVLVFRDGHREEVSNYTITDGILYTAGDPYSGESWSRKIELSSLNLLETVKSNHSRGIIFHLPSAPNEVVVRP